MNTLRKFWRKLFTNGARTMKAKLNPDGSLEIIANGTYEALALDAWYDKFFEHLRVHNSTPDGMKRPLLRINLIKDDDEETK